MFQDMFFKENVLFDSTYRFLTAKSGLAALQFTWLLTRGPNHVYNVYKMVERSWLS